MFTVTVEKRKKNLTTSAQLQSSKPKDELVNGWVIKFSRVVRIASRSQQ